jgi:hypothetical protein
LKIHINHISILVNGSPQIMLLTIDLYEDFIDVEGITLASVLALQSTSINSYKLDAPEADRLASDSDASFSQ